MQINLKKSQALVEMAIFGTLMLVVLGSLLSYLQKMNEQQYVTQEAFRRSLAKAYEVRSSANYTVMVSKRDASIGSPLVGDRSSYSGSGAVVWGILDEDEDDPGGSFYRVNDDEFKLDLDGDGDGEDDAEIEDVAFSADTDVVNNRSITHAPNQVKTYHKVDLGETITYSFNDESGNSLYAITQHIGPDGSYSQSNSSNSKYTKERKWISSYE